MVANLPRVTVSLLSLMLLLWANARSPVINTRAQAPPTSDWRNIKTGFVIPDEGYSDQPYVVITNDGNWLCVMTTGKGVEGEGGQHVVATISRDKGRTWSALIDVEPNTGPEASWAVPLKTSGGRVYVFYTYNKANIREVPGMADKHIRHRVDTLGVYAYKYSDDHGRTWSKDRYEIPLHVTEADRDNNFAGQTLFFWGVSKPIVHKGAAYWGWNRVTRWGEPGVLVRSQGHFMRSDNILTESDVRRIRWQILPASDEGLRAPKGPIAEEINPVSLSDGSLYATYRTIDGYMCHAYSRDDGRTWTPPEYATYAPQGRRIKHPRAYSPVWKTKLGRYLLWYHNHGGEAVHTPEWTNMPTGYYRNRNPVWLSGGVERDGRIHWSEPEIILYDDDPAVRMSYPDLIEEDTPSGKRYFLTETQKSIARLHELDPTLLAGLWQQFDLKEVAQQGLILNLSGERAKSGASLAMPQLPNLREGHGFSFDFWIKLKELSPGQTILDARGQRGQGIALTLSDRFTIKLTLNDGQVESSWDSDPGTYAGTLKTNTWQHVAVIVDGGPKIISFVVDGVLNDGGAARQYGWGRINPALGDVNGARQATLAPKLFGELKAFRVYNRYLRTSEAVGNYRAGY